LRPEKSLLSIFEDCHNHIYANDGFLKDRVFQEFVKLLIAKLYDERKADTERVAFYVTRDEYDEARGRESARLTSRLEALIVAARRDIAAPFGEDVSLRLSDATLAYVVARLQWISLSSSPADAKGEAFQTFVYRHQRGDRGEFFTPQPAVRLAVEIIDPRVGELVMDPACGSAGFLIETLRYIAQTNQQADRGQYVSESLRGLEFNPDIARSAELRLLLEGGSGSEIRQLDTLAASASELPMADVILTNPPFGSKGKVESQTILGKYDLGHKWVPDGPRWRRTASLLQGQTPEVLFVERSIAQLKPGGRMAMVVPDGLLHNSTLAYVRWWIREKCELLGVVSLPSETFVPYGTGIKTSVLFVRRKPTAVAPSVFMTRVNNVGYDVKGKSQAGSEVDEAIAFSRGVILGRTTPFAGGVALKARDVRDRLDVEHYDPSDRQLVAALAAGDARPLSEIAEIVRVRDRFRRNGGAIDYVAISDVDTRLLAIVSKQRLDAHDAPSRATYRLAHGDVITAVSGASTGSPKHAVAIVEAEDAGAICSNGFAVLRSVREVHPYYLAAFMRSAIFQRQVRRLMTGHAIPAISLEDLGRVLVPVPSLADQQPVIEQVSQLLRLRSAAVSLGAGLGSAIMISTPDAARQSSSVA
jgi:type I restriction enzyme M protein